MRYPLGSFPQYGYQSRNAAMRRQVAQENSAATLKAKALRNCTAHGVLSPNKVQEWGLTEAFKQLPQALFKIDAGIFEILGS